MEYTYGLVCGSTSFWARLFGIYFCALRAAPGWLFGCLKFVIEGLFFVHLIFFGIGSDVGVGRASCGHFSLYLQVIRPLQSIFDACSIA